MTREEYINNILKEYDVVSKLSNKNDSLTMRIRHKILKKDIVLHSFATKINVYSLLCKINSNHLPEVFDSIPLDDGQIVLEEYIDGITLADDLENKQYDKKEAKKIINDLCLALEVLHTYGYVHRDIKPENVIINKNKKAVLIDFNACRTIKLTEKDTVILGTVGYVAPEQLGITQSDTRTDIYALGILLNVMLTGSHPCNQIATGKMGKIIKNCTNINPNQRYQTVKELIKDL